MKKLFLIFFLSFSALTFFACEDDNLVVKGTVTYQSLEGGFFGIEGDDGNNYDPMNLPEEYRVNGLRVEVEFKKRDDLMGIHMWGTIIEVTNIRKLE